MFAFFGDPCRTKVPGSSVFEGSLCVLGCVQSVFGAICLLCGRGKRFGSFGGSQLCFVWQAQDIGHIAKTLAGVGHNTRCRQFCVRRNIWLTWTML